MSLDPKQSLLKKATDSLPEQVIKRPDNVYTPYNAKIPFSLSFAFHLVNVLSLCADYVQPSFCFVGEYPNICKNILFTLGVC